MSDSLEIAKPAVTGILLSEGFHTFANISANDVEVIVKIIVQLIIGVATIYTILQKNKSQTKI